MIQKVYGQVFNFMKISKIIPYVLNEELEKNFSFPSGSIVIVKYVLSKLYVIMD